MKNYKLFLLFIILGALIYPIQAANAEPTITSVSTDFISVTTQPYSLVLALYGDNLDYLLFNNITIELGSWSGNILGGNATGINVAFQITPDNITENVQQYPIIVKQAEQTLITTNTLIIVFNPLVEAYKNPHTKHALNYLAKKHQLKKSTIGLNVHWALGSDTSMDELYAQRLQGTGTQWVREHFSVALLNGTNASGWQTRYDKILLNYKRQGIKVVGMLAYGYGNDVYAAPKAKEWKKLIRPIIKRYSNYVDVWEIWDEPDSTTYLHPNNWKTYAPLLKNGYYIIKKYDPSAIVLNGAVSDINDRAFIKKLYTHGQAYFDELNIHMYYCRQYQEDGEHFNALQTDWKRFMRQVKKYNPNEKVWITELGCSTGSVGIDDALVTRYIPAATQWLRKHDNVRPIFLYTMRDRPYLEPYEANFGLLYSDGAPKSIWAWYRKLHKK